MKFFVPQAPSEDYQAAYDAIAKLVREQMRLTLTERKIYQLDYVHDDKRLQARVGQLDPQQDSYEVLAIFESKPHIIYTRSPSGEHGLTILVTNDEITEIIDFED